MENKLAATLKLQNGMEFKGWSFGYDTPCEGEVVFSTSMVGYPESLTDPSYSGQILCVTYPLIGNYGVPDEGLDAFGISRNFESEKIWVKALVISDYSFKYSHWNAVKSLDEWLKEHKIPGIYGVDTRELTKVLRDSGSMSGRLYTKDFKAEGREVSAAQDNQIENVSCKEIIKYSPENSIGKKVVLIDCGVKHNILRYFLERGVELIRVPWNCDFNSIEYDGLFISNGPGNPKFCEITASYVREAMKKDKPIFGVCMGNHILAMAGGAETFKLKYGHRSHQPVRMVGTNKCFITSQNHGYAVDEKTLGKDWSPWFVNMNDGTNEGIIHRSKPFCSVQFLPEASGGPTDTEFLFDDFISKL